MLYNDKFIDLYKDKLVIKTYYFPIATKKNVSINEIRCIYFKKQEETILSTKGWGMAITVWWACDMKRQLPSTKTNYYNVVIDTGTFIKQGFTVVDIHRFLKAFRPLTNAPFENRFPDAFEKRDKLVEIESEVLEVTEEKRKEMDKNLHKYEIVTDISGPPPSYDETVKTSLKNSLP